MPIGDYVRAWRLAKRESVSGLAGKTGLTVETLDDIEGGMHDPSISVVERLAGALGIPPSWLHSDPHHFTLLTTDGDGETIAALGAETTDPVLGRILAAGRKERDLFVLLTALLESGEPKLVLAAEASLRSLIKQARRATIPWQSRPSGHFEPPSD